MENKNIKSYVIIVFIIVLFVVGCFVISKLKNTEKNVLDEPMKNYEINEYIPTYVSDEAMVKIYLDDYVNTMYSNIEEAYNLLDEEYRDKKFGSLEAYSNYVYNLPYENYILEKFYKKDYKGYLIFGAYDNNGNLFIFKTKGVMQYKVYLDDETVEITPNK